MDPKSIKPARRKLPRGVCRLCGDDFSSLKDRCDLIPGGGGGKPLFTLALEDITGPVCAEDDLTAVCVRCKQHLTRYYRHKSDVERRGTALKDMAAKSVFTRKKRPAAAELAPKPQQRKRPKYAARRGRAAAAGRPAGAATAQPLTAVRDESQLRVTIKSDDLF